MNATQTKTETIAATVLDATYRHFGFTKDSPTFGRIMANLNNNTDEGEYGTPEASGAAEKVREILWNTYSGGGASAAATCNLFYALGRQNELGWVAGEAAHPNPYGDREYAWFLNRLDGDSLNIIQSA